MFLASMLTYTGLPYIERRIMNTQVKQRFYQGFIYKWFQSFGIPFYYFSSKKKDKLLHAPMGPDPDNVSLA